MLFYRFRPIDNFLSTDIKECTNCEIKASQRKGELSENIIYFPTRNQLNDPLEGVRNYQWKGDKVIWQNFFRNFAIFHTLLIKELIKTNNFDPDLISFDNINVKNIESDFFNVFKKNNLKKDYLFIYLFMS